MGQIAIEHDVYLEAWVHYLKPILDIGGTYESFVEANRGWMTQYSPISTEARNFLSIEKPLEEERFTGLWDNMDRWCRYMGEPVTLREYERLGKPWGIIISETMLKFHRDDKRIEIRENFTKG